MDAGLLIVRALSAHPSVVVGVAVCAGGSALVSPAAAADAAPGDPRVEAAPPIVVTGSRTERPLTEAPVSTEVVSRREMEESGARNVAEALEQQGGLYIEPSFAGSGISLQGLAPDYTLILIDGQRAIGRVGGVIDLRRFPLENVERIEIVRGASSALYGSDALGGVVNIITRRGQKPHELDGQASFGQRYTLDARGRGGVRHGDGWSSLSGGLRRSGAYDLDPSDAATSGSEIEQYQAALQSSYRFGALELGASGEYRYRAQDGIDESGGGAILDRRNRTEDASFSLRPGWDLGSGARLSARAGYSFFRDQFMLDQREGVAFDDYQDTREHLLQGGAQLDLWLAARHLASAGAEAFHERLSSERLRSGRGERQRAALYVQDEWTLVEQPLLVLLPGVRADFNSDFGTHVTPRVAARYDPSPEVVLRASLGLGFRAPDFREQLLSFENPGAGYVVEGNPELEPERSRSVTLSAEVQALDELWATLSLFRNDLDDMIATEIAGAGAAGEATRFRYANVSSAYTQGLEASVRISPLRGLRVDLSYAFVGSRDRELERRLAGRPRHRATFALAYSDASTGFETSWRAALVGERRYYEDEDADGVEEARDAAAYANVDLRVAQRIGYGLSAFGLAENLLDAGDAELLPLPPRTFSLGLSYVF